MPLIKVLDDDDGEFTGVELGFADGFDADARLIWKIWSTGKIGGRPEWLETRRLPRPEDLICRHCKEPMHFLAQMYAPVDDLPRAFHRVLYVFCCRQNVCLRKEKGGAGAIRVLRAQLPEKNELYAPDFEHSKKEEELELMDDDEMDKWEEMEWNRRVRDANEAEERTKKALNLASELKKKGNAHYSQNKWNEAIESYTNGLEALRDVYTRSPYRMLPSSDSVRDLICVLRSNRCQALVCLERSEEALKDASYVVSMKSDWAKAHYRRIKALSMCNMDTKDAKRTYENLLKRLRKGMEQEELTEMYVREAYQSREGKRFILYLHQYTHTMILTEHQRVSSNRRYLLKEMNLECEPETTQLEEEQNSNDYDDVKIEEDDEDDTTEDDLHKALGPRSWKADKTAVAFQKRTKPFPDQCVRYSRWNDEESVLWPSEERKCESEIPKCPHCGSTRKFELQITPQMLHVLHLGTEAGSTDWETIAVYTCTNSCVVKSSYAEEYAWAQTSQKNFMC